MNEEVIVAYIRETFEGVEVQEVDRNWFFFFGEERKMPFATLVTHDDYEKISQLDRPGVFRLNVGVSKGTYEGMFGKPPTGPIGAAVFKQVYHFAALDVVMPHPVYGQMCWVGVLNPSEGTFEKVKGLLAEGFEIAKKKGT